MRPWMRSLVVYAAAAAFMGRSVLATLWTHVASDPGDPLLTAAVLAWNATHVPWTEAWYQFPIFHPTPDALTLSEHLLGLSVVAAPLYWVTGSAVAAQNLTLLLTYPLAGTAMYALVWSLTRSSPAAFVAGLAFAFAPYRASQLPHIQMLAVFWAPLALLGLHRFAEIAAAPDAGAVAAHKAGAGVSRYWWLALFAACWALQGAANGYMLVYFSLIVGAWVGWFLAARGRWRDVMLVAAAAAAALLPLAPILVRYLATHRELGFSRNLGEISSFSADIAAMSCAPPTLAAWGWLRFFCAPEGELFPGVGLFVVLISGAALGHLRRSGPRPVNIETAPDDETWQGGARGKPGDRRSKPLTWWTIIRRVTLRVACAIAALFAILAAAVWTFGPWRLELGPLRASASTADKPLSTALALLLIAFLLSDRLRAAVSRGSMVTFYAGAAVVCWILAWGPFPRLLGVPVLYQAPYAWLLQLPGVDSLRAPARWWMIGVLCLSVLAGLTIARVLHARRARGRTLLVSACAAVMLLDGWTTIPAIAVPPPPADAATLRGRPVLVAPVGDVFGDAAAVYHAVIGGWTAVNGYSGHEPGYYEALRTLSMAGDERAYTLLAARGGLHVVEGGRMRRLPAQPRRPAPRPDGERLPLVVRETSCSPESSGAAVDGDASTLWVCGPQTADQEITVDAGREALVGSVVHALGSAGAGFPRHLVVETSLDGERWETAWEGSPAAEVFEAALASPADPRVVIAFPPRAARFIRLRQTGRHESSYWTIAELEAWSGP